MVHHASPDFWAHYAALPASIQELAHKQFELLKADPQHPSLRFKKLAGGRGREFWSVRVNLNYRALAEQVDGGYLWFWIGKHASYDVLI